MLFCICWGDEECDKGWGEVCWIKGGDVDWDKFVVLGGVCV